MAKIETVTDISTDIGGRQVTFKVSPDVDYQTELAQYASNNSHLEGYTIQ